MAEAKGPIILTGAAGKLAAILRPALAENGHIVRLGDMRRTRPLFPNEHFVAGALEKPRHMQRLMRGGAALIHFGGLSVEGAWGELIRSNVEGLTCCFEAARAAGIRRIIFASSMHVLGSHPRRAAIDEKSVPAPDSRYAATKIFGEAHARLLAEKYRMTITVLRIGHVVERMADAAPGQGIAADDFVAITMRALDFDDGRYRLWHLVAPHDGYPLSDGSTRAETGLDFAHPGPDRATIEQLLQAVAPLSTVDREFHGGSFARRLD